MIIVKQFTLPSCRACEDFLPIWNTVKAAYPGVTFQFRATVGADGKRTQDAIDYNVTQTPSIVIVDTTTRQVVYNQVLPTQGEFEFAVGEALNNTTPTDNSKSSNAGIVFGVLLLGFLISRS